MLYLSHIKKRSYLSQHMHIQALRIGVVLRALKQQSCVQEREIRERYEPDQITRVGGQESQTIFSCKQTKLHRSINRLILSTGSTQL
jgi:hypothetical protein